MVTPEQLWPPFALTVTAGPLTLQAVRDECATSRELLGSLSERESLVQPGPGCSVCSSLPYPNVILLQGL